MTCDSQSTLCITVRRLESVYAFDIDYEQAERYAKELSSELPISVSAVRNLSGAVGRSDICVTCTPSKQFFLNQADVAPGAFIAAAGADNEEKQELDPRLVAAGGTSATAIIGNALMLRILAFLLFSQPAGVVADRISRKKILIVADILRFALLALFPFINAVWQIYALIFAINSVRAFFTPTFEASIPEVVGEERYVQAISYSRVAVDIEAVAAPAIAGLLVALLGVRWVFWFDSFTYLASALFVAFAVIPQAAKEITPRSWRTFLNEITHGTRVLLREPALRQALTLSFAEATAGAAAIVVTVAYVRNVLGYGETAFAMVMAGFGLGSTMAAILLGRATGRYEQGADTQEALHGRRHWWAANALLLGGLMLGLLLLPGVLAPPLIVFCFLWVLNGAGQALIAIPSSTMLAEHTVAEERGRAYAAHFALTHACWLVTYPAVGHAAARWGAPATFTTAGVVCLVITAGAKFLNWGAINPHTHLRDGSRVA